MKQTLTVKGMHCNSCKVLITEALEDAGAKDINIALNKDNIGTIHLTSDMPKEKIKAIIEEQGDYKVV